MSTMNNNRTLSEINVTPFVDVMLVLLIIFMVTAPLMHEGISLNLPPARGEPVAIDMDKNVIISIDENFVYLNDKPVSMDELLKFLKLYQETNPGQNIYLRGDKKVEYGRVIKVIDYIYQVGIENINLITAPFTKDEPTYIHSKKLK